MLVVYGVVVIDHKEANETVIQQISIVHFLPEGAFAAFLYKEERETLEGGVEVAAC